MRSGVLPRSSWRPPPTRAATPRRPLRLGLRSGAWAEVLDGLAAGDQLLPASAAVAAGARVRAAALPASAP